MPTTQRSRRSGLSQAMSMQASESPAPSGSTSHSISKGRPAEEGEELLAAKDGAASACSSSSELSARSTSPQLSTRTMRPARTMTRPTHYPLPPFSSRDRDHHTWAQHTPQRPVQKVGRTVMTLNSSPSFRIQTHPHRTFRINDCICQMHWHSTSSADGCHHLHLLSIPLNPTRIPHLSSHLAVKRCLPQKYPTLRTSRPHLFQRLGRQPLSTFGSSVFS